MSRVVNPGHILLESSRTRELRARLGENPPMVVSPYNRTVLIERPRNVSLVDWQGREPLAIRIEMISDEWDDRSPDNSVANRFHRLEKMAGLDDEPTEPPIVAWFANSPHDADHVVRPWIIETLEWNRLWYRRDDDKVVMARWSATITLRHFVADEWAEKNYKGVKKVKKKVANEKKQNRKKKKKLIGTVRDSHASLGDVAAEYLGDSSQWPAIAAVNGIRDPRNIKEGQQLILP